MKKERYFCSDTGCKLQRILVGAALFIVLVGGIFTAYRYRTANALLRAASVRNATTIQRLDNALKEVLLARQNDRLLGSGTLKQCRVKDKKGHMIPLSALAVRKKLLFYVAAHRCASCIEREAARLKKLAERIGKQSVFVIAEGYKTTYLFEASAFKDYPHLYQSTSYIFSQDSLLDAPIYAYVDENNQIKVTHSVTKSTDGGFASFSRLIHRLLKNDSLS